MTLMIDEQPNDGSRRAIRGERYWFASAVEASPHDTGLHRMIFKAPRSPKARAVHAEPRRGRVPLQSSWGGRGEDRVADGVAEDAAWSRQPRGHEPQPRGAPRAGRSRERAGRRSRRRRMSSPRAGPRCERGARPTLSWANTASTPASPHRGHADPTGVRTWGSCGHTRALKWLHDHGSPTRSTPNATCNTWQRSWRSEIMTQMAW